MAKWGSERRLWYRNTNEGRGEEEERQWVAQWYPKRSLNDGTDESGLLLAFCIIYLQVHSSSDVRLKLAVREYSQQSSNRGKSHFVSCTSQGPRRLTRIGQKFALVWWISDSSVLPFQQTHALLHVHSACNITLRFNGMFLSTSYGTNWISSGRATVTER